MTNFDKSDVILLCQYPEKEMFGIEPIEIRMADYLTLKSEEFTNDTIVDFGLKVINKQYNSKGELFTFYSSFWHAITTAKTNIKGSFEHDQNLSVSQKQHRRVHRYTKKVDLFAKKAIFFPICESDHWYLLLVVNPELMNPNHDRKENTTIFVLNSLEKHGNTEKTLKIVKDYLYQEWSIKKNSKARQIDIGIAKVAQQPNLFDCGLVFYKTLK